MFAEKKSVARGQMTIEIACTPKWQTKNWSDSHTERTEGKLEKKNRIERRSSLAAALNGTDEKKSNFDLSFSRSLTLGHLEIPSPFTFWRHIPLCLLFCVHGGSSCIWRAQKYDTEKQFRMEIMRRSTSQKSTGKFSLKLLPPDGLSRTRCLPCLHIHRQEKKVVNSNTQTFFLSRRQWIWRCENIRKIVLRKSETNDSGSNSHTKKKETWNIYFCSLTNEEWARTRECMSESEVDGVGSSSASSREGRE